MLHTMQGLTVELNPIHRTDVAVLMAWLRICLIKHTSRHFCRAVQLMEWFASRDHITGQLRDAIPPGNQCKQD